MRIMKPLFLLTSITSLVGLARAEVLYYEINHSASYIKYTAHATTHDMTGKVKEFWGWLKIDTDTKTIQGKIEAKAKSMTTGNSMRDNNTYKLLEVEDYPMITFEITGAEGEALANANEKKDLVGQEIEANVKGNFTLHGVTKNISLPVQVDVRSSSLKGTSSFQILLTDYGMEPPKFAMFEAENDVDIKVKIVFKEKKE